MLQEVFNRNHPWCHPLPPPSCHARLLHKPLPQGLLFNCVHNSLFFVLRCPPSTIHVYFANLSGIWHGMHEMFCVNNILACCCWLIDTSTHTSNLNLGLESRSTWEAAHLRNFRRMNKNMERQNSDCDKNYNHYKIYLCFMYYKFYKWFLYW